MQNKFLVIIHLLRLNSPTGWLLNFYPALWGILFASYQKDISYSFILLILVGSIVTRSAGCIINDLLDRNYDSKVHRTQNRPLANQTISVQLALAILSINLSVSLYILFHLNWLTVSLGFLAGCMILLYPLFKRFTYFAQVFLGLTFNLGSLISYANIQNSLSWQIWCLYFATVFWTLSYDTIYSFMDLEADKKINLKSMGILLEHNKPKFWLCFFNTIFLFLFFIGCYFTFKKYFLYLVLALGLIVIVMNYQVKSLKIYDSEDCLKKFKFNNYIGFILSIILFFNKIIYTS